MSYQTKMILPFAGMVVLAVIVTGVLSQYSSVETAAAPVPAAVRNVRRDG